MAIHRNINELPEFKNAVITIGSFDGVHRGHVTIINQLIAEADAVQGDAVLITFYPHPQHLLKKTQEPLLSLQTPGEKYAMLQQKGIKHIVEVPFTEAFASQPAESYISDFLIKRFHPHTIIIGYDHRFGKNREGDYHLLENVAEQYQYRLMEIPVHLIKNLGISSTRIRQALLAGDLRTATEYLGYDYYFTGLVVEGDKKGRTIGFPTANLQITDPNKLVPANGVYAVTLTINKYQGKTFKGIMNIGTRPTVQGKNRSIEVNIFDFDEDIYGAGLTITLKAKMRDEQKFAGLEALKTQLNLDKENALILLNETH